MLLRSKTLWEIKLLRGAGEDGKGSENGKGKKVKRIIDKYVTKTIEGQKSRSPLLLRGKLPVSGLGDKKNTMCGMKERKNQRKEEIRRLQK